MIKKNSVGLDHKMAGSVAGLWRNKPPMSIALLGGMFGLMMTSGCSETVRPAVETSVAAKSQVVATAQPAPYVSEYAAHVDPFIGTMNKGNTYPGAVMPFGMLAFSPENSAGDTTRTAAPGGYHYNAMKIRGFSLTRLSGTGCRGASGDIPFMPYTEPMTIAPTMDAKDKVYASQFSHINEAATPGYYRVQMENDVNVELSATLRSGIARFTYPEGNDNKMLIRTSHSQLGSGDAYTRVDAEKRQISGSVTSGNFCGYLDEVNRRDYYTLYFVAEFDTDFKETGAWEDGQLHTDALEARGGMGYGDDGFPPVGKGSGVWVGFDAGADHQVGMRVGISYVSEENALANLRAEQQAVDTVESVSQRAYRAWDDLLGKVEVASTDDDQLEVFYTALYHTQLHPNVFSDVNGEYRGFDNNIHKIEGRQQLQYANFSGWDVYRSQLQLVTLLDPKRGSDIAQSLLNQANQNKGVWDRWTHNNGSTSVMNGDPSAIAMANFVAFGAGDFDVDGAYDSLLHAARNPTALDLSDEGCPVSCRGQRPSLDQWLDKGYIATTSNSWSGAAETLEQVSADFSLAQWAKRMGKTDDYQEFMQRSSFWRNNFNLEATETQGYLQDRNLDGSWRAGFTPQTHDGFVEGSAAQYLWMVPFDGAGLMAALGGPDKAVARLDNFFRGVDGGWRLTKSGPLHAEMDNQPSIVSPWMYNFAGQAYRSQETVRASMSHLWRNGPDGIPGNDDLGQMSSWYVFSALGFYPLYPGKAELVLSTPLFEKARIRRAAGDIEVLAPGATANTVFIDSLKVNNQHTLRSWLGESFIQEGGTLEFGVSLEPNKAWGTSVTDQARSFALSDQ